ncbi:hypothetical protein KP509_12G053900 [Ceratopteris richardii]|uniref:DNA-directed RNA polymerase subunit n=1 Tax=Ceratopteris richardii TaxID=49495 RepID=A0A8T2TNM8_CERRI|nr:hypothetical protein KP509_12G053900 [Ceratopteris richardii]
MDTESSEPPLASLQMIGFDLLGSNDIIQSSTFDTHEIIHGSKNLNDARLGLPNAEGKCWTCHLANDNEYQCPGHFGHFSLGIPIFDPQHIHVLARLLNSICPNCGKTRPKQKGTKEQKVDTLIGSHQCLDEDCKYCKINASDGMYPQLKFKVVMGKVGEVESETIEMHVVINENGTLRFPADFWSFIDRSVDPYDRPPRLSRPLLPAEAIRILERVPGDLLDKSGVATRPSCLINRRIPVPPNCLRYTDGFKQGYGLRRLEINHKTRALSSVLSRNKASKKSYDDLFSAHKYAMELQARVASYYKSFKVFSSKKDDNLQRSKHKKKRNSKQQAQRSGQTWFRMNILGKRSHFSSSAVLCGAPNITLQQLAIPRYVAQNLKLSERVTAYNLSKIEEYAYTCSNRCFVTRDKEKRCLFPDQGFLDLKKGDIIERPLMDGDLVFSNRLPTLHKNSFLGFQAKIEDRHTFGINPILCGPISGDFDGDILQVYAPQSVLAKAEISELLDLSHQLISTQGGQALLKLSQDGILSSHLILENHFWLLKHEIQMLNMYCDSPAPRPTIIKAPGIKAPLWTGIQVLNMTFPPGVEYTYLGSVVVHDSEIMQCPAGNKWLTDCHMGIVPSLCYQKGTETALQFLTCLQNVLHEWLFQTGFSVGLKDMYLTDEIRTYKKLLEEVHIAVDDGRLSSQRVLTLERQIRLVLSGKEELIPRTFINPCHSDILDYGYQENFLSLAEEISARRSANCEFQRVLGEIPTVVERHSCPSNSMMAMIRAGSKGSLSNLIQQCACLGLQSLNGEGLFFSDFHDGLAIIHSCFLDGLTSKEFLSHLVSSRKPGKGYGAEGPGELFRKCMYGLREVYLAYDGSVRTRTDNHVIQFNYEVLENIEEADWKSKDSQSLGLGSEPVGVLAVTSLIEPAYSYAFRQSAPTRSNPIELLKETLLRCSGTSLKGIDHKSILAISSNTIKRKTDPARVALQIQRHLHCFTLGMLPVKTMIEYDFQKTDLGTAMLWIIHMHVPQIAMKGSNVVSDVLSMFSQAQVKHSGENFFLSDCLHCDKNEACIRLMFDLNNSPEEGECSFDNKFLGGLNLIKHTVLPLLQERIIRGSRMIKATAIHWKDFVQWSSLFDRSGQKNCQENQVRGEIFVEVNTSSVSQRGKSWELVENACSEIAHYIDWRRSRPYSIAEVFSVLGIEAARTVIYERLQQCTYKLGMKIWDQHLLLICDFMTHSGKVLPFTASGMKEWHKIMNISAPFTEGTFQGWSSTALGKSFIDLPTEIHQHLPSMNVAPYQETPTNLQLPQQGDLPQKNFDMDGILHKHFPVELDKLYSECPPGFEYDGSKTYEKDDTVKNSQLPFTVRRILHHRYKDGEKLSEEDMHFLIENVLIYHPKREEKIGCGIAAIKIGHNVKYPESRCFILCRKDGTTEDFSYNKCLQNIG